MPWAWLGEPRGGVGGCVADLNLIRLEVLGHAPLVLDAVIRHAVVSDQGEGQDEEPGVGAGILGRGEGSVGNVSVVIANVTGVGRVRRTCPL